MNLSAGGSKGNIAEMNVVPLIDILLVLIIIFMVISPATPMGLSALIPQARTSGTQIHPSEAVIVQLLAGGELKINRESQTWETLGPRLEEIFKQRAEKVAFVQSDDAVLFSQVARAIDVIRSRGVEKVGLMTVRIAKGE